MTSGRTVLRGAVALLGDELSFDGRPRDVLVEQGRIVAIEPAGSIHQPGQLIELPRRLLAPGLVNGHQHSHEHFQRGRTENLPLELWQHLVRGRMPLKLTPRQAYLRAQIGAIEALRTGCTTLVDDLALGAAIDREVVDAVLQAYDDSGVRALLGFAMMDKPMVDNFPFVDELLPAPLVASLRSVARPSADQFVDLMRGLVASRHPHQRRVGVLVSASAPQRCTDGFLRRLRGLADELALPLITHVQETRLQVVTGLHFYGMPIVEHLAEIGFLKPATSLIHAVWLNPREIAALAEAGATAQHNPWSNLLLGSGVQPVRELLDAGVNVSLGSDGSCSTVTTNMLQVVGAAAGLSKLRGHTGARWLSAHEAWHAGTLAGGRALGFGDTLGSLKVGARADLVGYRLDSISFTPLNDPLRQLAYAERGAGVDFCMVDGEVALQAARLTRIDESALLEEIAVEFQGLSARDAQADDVSMQMHLLETVYQKEYARRRTGTTAVKHLDKLGALGPWLTLGHAVWLTEEDVELVAHSKTCVCHNCSSNFRLRSGVAPINDLAKRGVTIGMGLDEAGINEDRDMLQEMKLALRAHRVPGMDDDDVPSCLQVLRMASEHGAKTTAFRGQIGRLDPGMQFDAVAIDYRAATYPYQDEDIPVLDALVQRAHQRHVDTVYVGGDPIYAQGRFKYIDRDKVLGQIAEQLSRPRTPEEQKRRQLSQAVFPHVKSFYANYLSGEPARQPFYGPSSRT